MASYRYEREIDPNEPQGDVQAPMTPKKKWQNFWFYHKWHVLIAVLIALFSAYFIWDVSNRVEPDYSIGVITFEAPTGGVFTALEQPLAAYGEDLNGDGQVVVAVNEYDLSSEDPSMIMASNARLTADFQISECLFFITDNVQKAQTTFEAFIYNDGTVPESGQTVDYSKMGIAWEDCAVLAGLDAGYLTDLEGNPVMPLQEHLKDFYVLQRIPPDTDKDAELKEYWENGQKFTNKLLGLDG